MPSAARKQRCGAPPSPRLPSPPSSGRSAAGFHEERSSPGTGGVLSNRGNDNNRAIFHFDRHISASTAEAGEREGPSHVVNPNHDIYPPKTPQRGFSGRIAIRAKNGNRSTTNPSRWSAGLSFSIFDFRFSIFDFRFLIFEEGNSGKFPFENLKSKIGTAEGNRESNRK